MEPYATTETIQGKKDNWLEHIAPFNTHIMPLTGIRPRCW